MKTIRESVCVCVVTAAKDQVLELEIENRMTWNRLFPFSKTQKKVKRHGTKEQQPTIFRCYLNEATGLWVDECAFESNLPFKCIELKTNMVLGLSIFQQSKNAALLEKSQWKIAPNPINSSTSSNVYLFSLFFVSLSRQTHSHSSVHPQIWTGQKLK